MFDETGRGQPKNALLPLRVQSLSFAAQGVPILRAIDLEVSTTGCTVIMGPNGAGKTQLLRIIHGLSEPDSGSVLWNGCSPAGSRHRQALVFQKPVLLRRSVAANVDFVLRARGLPITDTPALLKQVGLKEKSSQPARLLSGGEAQRLALARALAQRPEVLLLDEPTANLDPGSTRQIEDIVSRVSQSGMKVIFITHNFGQASRLADDVVFMNRGQIAATGPTPAFWNSPPSKVVADFLDGRIID